MRCIILNDEPRKHFLFPPSSRDGTQLPIKGHNLRKVCEFSLGAVAGFSGV